MIELLHELKNSSFYHRNIQDFDNALAGRKENCITYVPSLPALESECW